MPLITLGFMELQNIAYCMYRIFYLEKEVSLVKDSTLSTVLFYLTLFLTIAGTVKIFCMSFNATKRLFSAHPESAIIEATGFAYIIASIACEYGSHFAIDMVNTALFVPTIICGILFENVTYSYTKIFSVYYNVLICNV